MARPDPTGRTPEHIPNDADPVIVARYAGLMLALGDMPEALAALDFTAIRCTALNAVQLIDLLHQIEKAGRTDLVAPVFDALAETPDLSLPAALTLARRLQTDPGALSDLAPGLAQRLPPEDRRTFLIEICMTVEGPDAALAVARRNGAARNPAEASQLGQLLVDVGRARHAVRYLARVLRAWPGQHRVARTFVSACIAADDAARAEAWIADQRARGRESLVNALEIDVLSETGRLSEALERIEATGSSTLSQRALRCALSLGRIEVAEARAVEVAQATARGARAGAHFSTSHHGSMLNELRLYQLSRRSGADDAELAQSYVFPATRVLDRLAPGEVPNGPSRIPRTIWQYWDTSPAPTGIDALMATWRGHEGWDHRVLDRRTAGQFLREQFGPDHMRAFRLANHASEEADFLRLCVLYAEGGIYVDADDKCLAGPDQLRDMAGGASILLFREPYRAIANNVILSAPNNPVLAQAIEMACASLLARENDKTWSKTGPGLLARALAVHLARCDENGAAPDLAVIPEARMRHVLKPHMRLPYKGTSAYWDAKGDPMSQALKAGLARLSAG